MNGLCDPVAWARGIAQSAAVDLSPPRPYIITMAELVDRISVARVRISMGTGPIVVAAIDDEANLVLHLGMTMHSLNARNVPGFQKILVHYLERFYDVNFAIWTAIDEVFRLDAEHCGAAAKRVEILNLRRSELRNEINRTLGQPEIFHKVHGKIRTWNGSAR